MRKIAPILLFTSVILFGCSSGVEKLEKSVEYANYKTAKANSMYESSLDIAKVEAEVLRSAILDYLVTPSTSLDGVDIVIPDIHQELAYIIDASAGDITIGTISENIDIRYYYDDNTYVLEQVVRINNLPNLVTGISLKWFDGRLISVEKITY